LVGEVVEFSRNPNSHSGADRGRRWMMSTQIATEIPWRERLASLHADNPTSFLLRLIMF